MKTKKLRMIDPAKLFELRCRLADSNWTSPSFQDESLLSRPAKKKKRKPPQKIKVDIEDVSDGKL